MVLPAGYVREHVSLGYAATIHAAQGVTVDRCHTVLTPATTAAGAYVGLTRGREHNTAHTVTQPQRPAWDADYHQMTRHEYDQLLQQRRGQLDADHTAGTLTDQHHAYLRDHVAALSPQALREAVTHWTPTAPAEHTTTTGQADTQAPALEEAAPLPHEIADRAGQLYATGRYPDYARAHHAAQQQATAEAHRRAGLTADWIGPEAPEPADRPHTTPAEAAQAADSRRRHAEDQILTAAGELDPDDDSLPARQLRQTAASIHDHRTSPTQTSAADTTDPAAAGEQTAERSVEALDRVVADMREAFDGRQQMPPFRPYDQAGDAERRLGWVSDHAHPELTDQPATGQQLAGQAADATARIHATLDRLAARTPARQRLAATPPPPAAGHTDQQTRAEADADE